MNNLEDIALREINQRQTNKRKGVAKAWEKEKVGLREYKISLTQGNNILRISDIWQ